MKKSLTMALAGAALILGVTASLMSGPAVAHHTTQHSLAQCGSIVCTGGKQVPTAAIRGR